MKEPNRERRKQKGESEFISGIRELLIEARESVVRQVNTTILTTYYEIGRRIVEQEQQGKEDANNGEYILVRLSESISGTFGKGFFKRNLELMRISDPDERFFYEIEAAENNGSVVD